MTKNSEMEAKAAILDKCCQSVECLARGKVFDLVGTLDLPQSSSSDIAREIIAEIVECWDNLKRDEGAFPPGDRRAAMSEHRLWQAIQPAKAWLKHSEVSPDGHAQTPIEAALRDAFPHFQDDAPITPEAIKGIGKEYFEMVMGWEPQKTEIEFADDDGNIRKIVYEPGEYEAGSFPGWVLADDAVSHSSTLGNGK